MDVFSLWRRKTTTRFALQHALPEIGRTSQGDMDVRYR